jgi:hypothetical protein
LYTLILRANSPILISSMIATCLSGTVLFELWNGLPAESLPGGTVTAPITSTATPALLAESIAANGFLIDVGDRLTLRLVVQSANAEDFAFSIAYASA